MEPAVVRLHKYKTQLHLISRSYGLSTMHRSACLLQIAPFKWQQNHPLTGTFIKLKELITSTQRLLFAWARTFNDACLVFLHQVLVVFPAHISQAPQQERRMRECDSTGISFFPRHSTWFWFSLLQINQAVFFCTECRVKGLYADLIPWHVNLSLTKWHSCKSLYIKMHLAPFENTKYTVMNRRSKFNIKLDVY